MFKGFPRYALVLLIGAQAALAGMTPRFELVGSATAELGQVECFENKAAVFRLKNSGPESGVILRLIPTCSCLTATSDKTWVKPQEEAEIRVVLDTSKVHGAFKRVLWVDTTDPALPRFALTLQGEAVPLFHGLPETPRQVVLPVGASWTNRFTLTGFSPDLSPGYPTLATDTNTLAATVALATNIQGTVSYALTLTVSTLAPGRHTLVLTLPAEGRPNLPPVKLTYHVHAGLALRTIPSKISLSPTNQPLSFLLNVMTADRQVMTSDKSLDPCSLTWTPGREGVSVSVEKNPKFQLLQARLTLSPEAITNLLEETDPQLTFHYPNYAPASLRIAVPQKPAAQQGQAAPAP